MNITINIKDGEIKQPNKGVAKRPRLVRPGRAVSTPARVLPAAVEASPTPMPVSRTAFPIASRQQVAPTASQPTRLTAARPSTGRRVANSAIRAINPANGTRMVAKAVFEKKGAKAANFAMKAANPFAVTKMGFKAGKKLFKKFKRRR